MLDWLGSIFAFPITLIALALEAAQFSSDAFLNTAATPKLQTAALIIAFLAGVSEMAGQSVILVVNRTPLYRFLASLAFTGLSYVATAVIWGACAIAVSMTVNIQSISWSELYSLMAVLCLAFAPRLLGVFAIAPYFGAGLANMLEAWAMALAVFGMHAALNMPILLATIIGLTGWFVSLGLRSFLGRALRRPLSKLRIAFSGSTLEKTPQQIIDDVLHRFDRERQT